MVPNAPITVVMEVIANMPAIIQLLTKASSLRQQLSPSLAPRHHLKKQVQRRIIITASSEKNTGDYLKNTLRCH